MARNKSDSTLVNSLLLSIKMATLMGTGPAGTAFAGAGKITETKASTSNTSELVLFIYFRSRFQVVTPNISAGNSGQNSGTYLKDLNRIP
jgi:hypothetical protein